MKCLEVKQSKTKSKSNITDLLSLMLLVFVYITYNYFKDDTQNKELVKLIETAEGEIKFIYNEDIAANHVVHLRRKFINNY